MATRVAILDSQTELFYQFRISMSLRISERKDFSNSKFPYGSNASHQVWAQSDLRFGSRCGFKIFKMAAIFDSRTERF